MITLLFILWYTEIALKAAAGYRLYRSRLVFEYPILFIFVVTSVVKSSLLVQVRHDPATYALVYSIAVPVMLVLQYLCGIEIFERLTRNYPQFGRAGKVFLAGFAILGVTATTATRHMGVPATWQGLGEAAILLDRYALVALFVGLVVMAAVVPRDASFRVPANARRAAMIMAIYVFGNAASVVVAIASGAAWPMVPSYVIVVTGLVAALGWITLPRSKGTQEPSSATPRTVRQAVRDCLRFTRTMRESVATGRS